MVIRVKHKKRRLISLKDWRKGYRYVEQIEVDFF